MHNHYLSVVDLFTWTPYLIIRKLVRTGWILRKWDSLIISSICGCKVMESNRVNMYRTMFTKKKSSKSNKGKYFFCARWPRWGQYQYWHWHCQVHGLHDYNLIKMCQWQKPYHRMFYYTSWFVWPQWHPSSFTKLLQNVYPALQNFMLTAKIVRPKFIEHLTYLLLIIKKIFFSPETKMFIFTPLKKMYNYMCILGVQTYT